MRSHLFSTTLRRSSSLLIGGALLSCNLFAQEAYVQPEVRMQETPVSTEAEALARSVRRILHFKHGGTMTAVARFVDDQWQVKTKGDNWQSFPADAVERAPKEADVQREMKKRSKTAHASKDTGERVELARWMADEGLLSDALRELDGVLEASPHNAAALTFLRERPLLRVPAARGSGSELAAGIEPLMKWAAKAPTAARELAIEELRGLEDQANLQSALIGGLANFSFRRRAFCAQALGRLFPGEQAKRLLQHAVLDSSQDVRREAAQALGNAAQPGLIVPVARALNSSNIRVRTQSAEALGFMGYSAAVEPLVNYITAAQSGGSTNRVPHGYIFVGKQTAYIQDFDVEVATFQAVADPQINVLLEGDVLEAGVSGVLEYSYSTEAKVARGSLSRLTGADPGNTGRSWQRWWQKNQSDWKNDSLSTRSGTASE